MQDLAVRAMVAKENAASVTAGSTTYSEPSYPDVGSQPRRTEKNPMRINPSQKGGMEAPSTLAVVMAVSHGLVRHTAAAIPAGNPSRSATARLTEARNR